MPLLHTFKDKDPEGLTAEVHSTLGKAFRVAVYDSASGELIPEFKKQYMLEEPAIKYARKATNQEETNYV